MAGRKLIVEVVADTSQLTKSMNTLRGQTKKVGSELEHAGRGALTGAGAFHSLGRSIAFASGGFLAFEGASRFLTESINAAREAAVAQRSLAAQMKAAGESFRANREEVEKVSLSYERFGFQNDEVIQSLTVLERGTGNINQAIRLQGVTADIARAKNIDLAAAANTVAKVFGGQETALRRAVPGLEKNAHGWDLIRLAQAKMAGQAAANTTVSERFAATLHDTEEIVGTALLPILNKYLTSLGNWLQRMNESGKLQKDVNAVTHALADAVGILRGAFGALNTITGSTQNSMKLLFKAFIAFKALQFASSLKLIATNMSLIGRNAATATPQVERLGAAQKGVGPAPIGGVGPKGPAGGLPLIVAPPPIIGGKTAQEFLRGNAQAVPNAPGVFQIGSHFYVATASGTKQVSLAEVQKIVARNLLKAQGIRGPVGQRGPSPLPTGMVGVETFQPAPVVTRTAEQRNTFFDAMIQRQLGRVQDITSLGGQLTRLRAIGALITKRIAATRDITRKLNLEDQVLAIARQKKEVRQQIAEAFIDRLQFGVDLAGATATLTDDLAALRKLGAGIEKRIKVEGATLDLLRQRLAVREQTTAVLQQQAEQTKAAAEAAQAARTAAQFAVLGLGPTGEDLVPGVASLKKHLAAAQKAIEGSFLNTDKTRSMLRHIRQVLAGGLGAVSDEVRAKIAEMLNAIDEQLKQHGRDRTAFRHLSAQQFVDSLGLNLTPAERRRIAIGFAGVGPGGTAPGAGTPAFAGVTINGDVHVHGVQDPKGMETELTRRGKARAHRRRGRQ